MDQSDQLLLVPIRLERYLAHEFIAKLTGTPDGVNDFHLAILTGDYEVLGKMADMIARITRIPVGSANLTVGRNGEATVQIPTDTTRIEFMRALVCAGVSSKHLTRLIDDEVLSEKFFKLLAGFIIKHTGDVFDTEVIEMNGVIDESEEGIITLEGIPQRIGKDLAMRHALRMTAFVKGVFINDEVAWTSSQPYTFRIFRPPYTREKGVAHRDVLRVLKQHEQLSETNRLGASIVLGIFRELRVFERKVREAGVSSVVFLHVPIMTESNPPRLLVARFDKQTGSFNFLGSADVHDTHVWKEGTGFMVLAH
jgi:hypothetical protein